MKRHYATTALFFMTLAACQHDDDKAELAKLQSQIAAQQKRLAEQERQIVALQGELTAATAKHAPAPAPDSPQKQNQELVEQPWKLAITHLSHNAHSHSLRARFVVTNVTNNRLKGSLCAQLLDGGGAEIEHFVSPERAVPATGDTVIEVVAPLPDEQWSQVARLRAFVAPFGCTDEPPPSPLLVDRRGAPVATASPPSRRKEE